MNTSQGVKAGGTITTPAQHVTAANLVVYGPPLVLLILALIGLGVIGRSLRRGFEMLRRRV